jgi:hypothetical protein
MKYTVLHIAYLRGVLAKQHGAAVLVEAPPKKFLQKNVRGANLLHIYLHRAVPCCNKIVTLNIHPPTQCNGYGKLLGYKNLHQESGFNELHVVRY